jgi:AcrR family transcriptional regulator
VGPDPRAGVEALTVADVAAAAGVSRQLVYVHFENRAGLLVAAVRRHDVRSGFAGRAAEARVLAPVAALERLLREWFAYLPEILPVARALEAAAVNGDDGGAAWRDRMGGLREVLAAASTGSPPTAAWPTAGRRRRPPTGSGPAFSPRLRPAGRRPRLAAGDYVDRAVPSILAEVVSPGS